ncbi:50S ribosomal protein L9 [bacterium]|nr:50S ribosomal protein L9 [bacterium]
MEVILTKEVKGIGKPGDLVKVSDGHARNYLLPKKLAVEANPENKRVLLQKEVQQEKKQARQEKRRTELAETISALSCIIKKQVSEDNRIFGSVSHVDIVKCLQVEGIIIEKKQINLAKPIKTLGVHPVVIKLGKGTEAVLKIWIEKQDN